VVQLLPCSPRLASVQLHLHPFPAGSAVALASALPALAALTRLRLSDVPSDCLELAAAYGRCTGLRRLSLDSEPFSAEWVAAVSASLRALLALTRLELSGLRSAQDSAAEVPLQQLFTAMAACPALESVCIWDSALPAEVVLQACTAPQHHPALRELTMALNLVMSAVPGLWRNACACPLL